MYSAGMVLTQEGGEGLDHPISFTSHRLSKLENNYSTTKREGLAMVYLLQKYRHYLLGGHFNMYTSHSVLKYLVNKPMLGGYIFRSLLLFQEYDFKVIIKHGCLNSGSYHFSRIDTREEPTSLEEGLPDAQFFVVCVADAHFEDIVHFLTTGTVLKEYSI